MDIQAILVIILFVTALAYIGRLIYAAISPKKGGCASNCKCGIDFSDIYPEKK